MADLKISQLPSAETLANTDLIPVKTTAGTKAITFENLKASQEGYFKRVIAEYMQFDYEDLKALRDDGELIAGQKYLLTDYQTVYRQDRGGTYVDKISAVEPLILTAVSTNEFSSIAYSPSYPQDIIWYNFDNELSPDNASLFYSSVERISKGFKGIILRRIDTQKNIDYSYDWRTMLWWRDVISGIIPEAGEYLTFRDLSNTHDVISGDSCYNNTFGNNCYNITFGNACYGNTFGSNCYSNTFDESCSGNTLGNYCHSNTFGDSCHNNTFDNSCYNNTFGDSCHNNTFGSYCSGNTFGNNCSYNTFGNNCSYNTFGNNCFSNTFGSGCYENTFGNNCFYSIFGSECFRNTFGSGCYENIFANNLQYTEAKNGFTSNEVTNTAIYNKAYNHTFYIDSAGNKKCYCITGGAIVDVPLQEV